MSFIEARNLRKTYRLSRGNLLMRARELIGRLGLGTGHDRRLQLGRGGFSRPTLVVAGLRWSGQAAQGQVLGIQQRAFQHVTLCYAVMDSEPGEHDPHAHKPAPSARRLRCHGECQALVLTQHRADDHER